MYNLIKWPSKAKDKEKKNVEIFNITTFKGGAEYIYDSKDPPNAR